MASEIIHCEDEDEGCISSRKCNCLCDMCDPAENIDADSATGLEDKIADESTILTDQRYEILSINVGTNSGAYYAWLIYI